MDMYKKAVTRALNYWH